MKRHWTTEELQAHWKLLPTEKKLVKQRGGRHAQLGFAVLLKFFQNEGRFPRHRNDPHRGHHLPGTATGNASR